MQTKTKESLPTQPDRATATFEPYFWEAYNEIVEPRRFDHYLIRRWAPALGPVAFLIVKVLRDRCYHNPQTGVLRDTCEVNLEELGAAVGVSRATIVRELRDNGTLAQFVRRVRQFRMVDGRPQKDRNLYQVCMDDPIHPEDMERYDELRAIKERERYEGATQILGTTRIKRDDSPTYKAQNEPYRQNAKQSGCFYKGQIEPYSGVHRAQNEPTDTSYPKDQYDPTDATHLTSQNDPTIKDYLPSGNSYTKESLTPSADAPQHKCCPPEGEAEGESLDPLTALWQQALVTLSQQVNIPTFEAHLRPLRPVRLTHGEAVSEEGDTLVLAAPSAFTLEWILKRHEGHIREALSAALGRPITVQIVLESK